MSTPEQPADGDAASLASDLVARMTPVADAAAEAKEGIAADRERYPGDGEADALIETVIGRVDELEADTRRLMQILTGFEAAAAAPVADREPESFEEIAVSGSSAASPGEPGIVSYPGATAGAAGIAGLAGVAGAVAGSSAEPEVAEAPIEAESEAPVAEQPQVETPEQPQAEVAEEAAAHAVPAAAPSEAPPTEPPGGDPVAMAPPAGVPVDMPPPQGAPVVEEQAVPEPEAETAAAPTEAEPEPESEAPPTAEPESDVNPEGAPPESDEPVHVSEGVRLLATQMSVAGASSSDIAKRLSEDFGVENADRLIAQLFGPGPSPRS
ncbi:MAG: hypothetical protein KDB58_08220 [Solirubrobacterales bacterium]|nr:hypothetical protein [Solirubrobacterales bacterium]MCB8970311.1 hypothetical protein [Thermoleophilales bacterium]